jgi:putative ABC transport system substrate-binding protein
LAGSRDIPSARLIAAASLRHSAIAAAAAQRRDCATARSENRGQGDPATAAALELIPNQISNNAGDIEHAIESFAQMPEGGLLFVPDATIIAHRDLVITLAARYRLPAVYPWRYFVAAGALMSYGIDNIDVLQKAASYVDRILRGAKPADLPVQAPTKYETAVNLTAAKALGLTIPPTLLATADEVVE